MANHTGLLVAFEGIDNAGKTTQIERVANWLKSHGRNVLVSREMNTGIGKCFKTEFETGKLSPRVKALLFAADRYHRLESEILPALQQRAVVLADRWALSSIVYRSIEGQGLSLAEFINKDVTRPDIMFLIDVDPRLAYHRGQIAQRKSPYSEEFLSLAQARYREFVETEGLVLIDGSRSIEQVTQDIVERLAPLLEKSK